MFLLLSDIDVLLLVPTRVLMEYDLWIYAS